MKEPAETWTSLAPSVGAAITVPALNNDPINTAVANNLTFRIRMTSYKKNGRYFCARLHTVNGFSAQREIYACENITSNFFVDDELSRY